MSFSGQYICMDKAIELVERGVAHPSVGIQVFIEVQVREKRVYRTRSGLLLNHLPVLSLNQSDPPSGYVFHWSLFQIDVENLRAEDVFSHCCDGNSLLSIPISLNEDAGARFLNFFKRRVSSFCRKIEPNLVKSKAEVATILAHITTVFVFDVHYDYDCDCEVEHSLKVCSKSCVARKENPYGATFLPKGAFLFSPAHGSLEIQDYNRGHGESCSICLNELKKGGVIRICCGHAFHSKCLIPWFNRDGSCPMCRYGMRIYITRLRYLPNLILPQHSLTPDPGRSESTDRSECTESATKEFTDWLNLRDYPISFD